MFSGQTILFWTLPGIKLRCCADARRLCHPYVLWRRIRHDARTYGGLLWLENVGPIYGLMLTAWGFASAFGPLLIAPYAAGGWCVSWSPACDRGGDVRFRRTALDRIPTPPDRGSSKVYSASTAPGSVDTNWIDLCALSTNWPRDYRSADLHHRPLQLQMCVLPHRK